MVLKVEKAITLHEQLISSLALLEELCSMNVFFCKLFYERCSSLGGKSLAMEKMLRVLDQ